MERDAVDLGTLRVATLFRRYFVPTLFGMLSISAMTAIDGIFIGHGVGSDGIAAVNIGIPLLMVFTGLGLMSGVGCSVVASVHLSAGKVKAARLNVTQALIFVTAFTVPVIAAIMFFCEPVARLLGSSDTLLPLVKDYMMWFLPGLIPQMWVAVGLFVVRLDGAPNYAMWCSVASALANLFLDWLFIFPLQGGVAGAAFASTISQAIGGIMALAYLTGYAKTLRLYAPKLSAKSLRLSLRNIGYHCRIGSSALLGEATMAMLMLVGNFTFMHYMGDDGVGAFGVVCYYLPFVFMVGNAIAQSAQPIISYNFGLGNLARVAAAERIAVLTALSCGALVAGAFSAFPDLLVGLFLRGDDAAARIATEGFPYFATGFVPFVINLAMIGYFQSVMRVVPATVFALLRGLILLVPSFVLLPLALGNTGIWLAMPVSETLTMLAVAIFVLLRRAHYGR